jgi:PTH1 family peptidyl-tRNA hydrolase
VTRLILGLGNPGEEYRATRHNVGFRVVEELARRWQARVDRFECNALTALVERPPGRAAGPPGEGGLGAGQPGGPPGAAAAAPDDAAAVSPAPPQAPPAASDEETVPPSRACEPHCVLLAKPQTYMNRSGFAARCLVERHGLPAEAVLVVYDEVNLPLGRLRLRRAGSPAGHRGIESILENLRTEQVARLRVGIAVPEGPAGGDELVDFVLSPFAPAEEETLAPVLRRAADACEAWLCEGIDAAMSRFNGA